MANSNCLNVAAIQMVSGINVADNLQSTAHWIKTAVDGGARLVALPEYFCLLGKNDTDKLAIQEQYGDGLLQEFLSNQAKQHQIWLIGGTIPLNSPDTGRIYNTSLVFGPDGQLVSRYDKIHLFGFTRGDESFNESTTIRPGENQPQVFDLPFGKVGIGICYDLRFPEFFRAMGQVDLIVLPAAFTYTTGSAHWEVLLRARAIENQCYVLASAQGGKHENGRRTWGHSMLIDPWGEIVSCVPVDSGIASGTITQDKIQSVRQSLPALDHRVM